MKAGTKTLSITAAAIGTNFPSQRVHVQADPGNTINVAIGDSLTQPYILKPSDSLVLMMGDVGLIYAKGVSAGSPVVNWIVV